MFFVGFRVYLFCFVLLWVFEGGFVCLMLILDLGGGSFAGFFWGFYGGLGSGFFCFFVLLLFFFWGGGGCLEILVGFH